MKLAKSLQKAATSLFGYPRLQCQKTDYDQYWQSKRPGNLGVLNSFQKYRAEWVLARIQPEASVLDIGCGDGAILEYVSKRKSIKPCGADMSDIVLQHLRQRGIEVFKLDTTAPDSTASLPIVDHIILFEILEHMPDPEAFLRSVMKKATRSVFVSIPNSGYWAYRFRYLLGRFPVQWRVHPGEHVRFWTYKDLNWWLEELGIYPAELSIYEGIPVLNRMWRGLFGKGFIFEIQTRPMGRKSTPC